MKKTLTEAIEEAKKNPKDPNVMTFHLVPYFPLKYKLHPPQKHNKIKK